MFVQIGKAASHFGVHVETIRRWCSGNKIDFKRTIGGHRRIWIGESRKVERVDISYARVSSRSQKDDLERQKAALYEHNPTSTMVEDVASGLNWKRKGLRRILNMVKEGLVNTLYVYHRDRLGRACYNLIEEWCSSFGTRLKCLEDETLEDGEIMMQEVMGMLHVYSCKLHGMRSYRNRVLKAAGGG